MTIRPQSRTAPASPVVIVVDDDADLREALDKLKNREAEVIIAALPEQLPPWRGLSLLGALTAPTASEVLLHVEPGQSLAVQVRP